MNIKPEIKALLVVLLSGIVVVVLIIYIFNAQQGPARQLARVSSFETLLTQVEVSALGVRNGDISIQELTHRIDGLNQQSELLEEDLLAAIQKPLKNLNHEKNLMAGFHKERLTTTDSSEEQAKSALMPAVATSLQLVSTSVRDISEVLDNYVNILEYKVEQSNYYSYAMATALLIAFGAMGFWLYRRLKNSEDYKRATEMRLKREMTRMKTFDHFIQAIADGSYSETIEFEEGDKLAEKMMEMKNKLQTSAETDRKRNWTVQGIAEMATLLRNAESADSMYDDIVSFCVKYTHSNQASLFVINEENPDQPFLELVSTYAYERKKFAQKHINLGEGLVGQAVLEGETITMTKLPEKYLHITSGLGEALPGALVIVPLKINEKIYGVLEMASFKTYEPFEIEFLEKIGTSVASAISTARINDKTRELLEKSQQQTEELRAQEEEVRQNMEELSATQEQMERQMKEMAEMSKNLQERENVFALTTILSESDPFGTILLVNDKLVQVSKYSREELIGKPHSIFRHPDMPKQLFKLMWGEIKQGKVFRGIIKNRTKDNGHYWVDATIVPVFDDEGKIVKYIGARYHIIDDEIAEHMYNEQTQRLGLPPLNMDYQQSA